MSGPRRERRDSDSAFGQIQRFASNGRYMRAHAAYKAYFEHSVECVGCGYGEVKCSTATGLWEEYKAARA